jgi:hypothetical protein
MSKEFNKVFGIGFSRTGTTSLNAALNTLGIKSIHYPGDPETVKLLTNGIVRLPLLEEYDAITDIQPLPFYPQLDVEYPNSKFILTTRDMNAWLISMKRKMLGWGKSKDDKLFDLKGTYQQWMRTSVYGVITFNRSIMISRWGMHHTAVENYFKGRDNLLVMDICGGDGWEKLCPFLGKDIPDVEFPLHNASVAKVKKAWKDRGRDL